MAILEIAKNGIWSKKIRELDLFDFTSFFLVWSFLNILACCALTSGKTNLGILILAPEGGFCVKSIKVSSIGAKSIKLESDGVSVLIERLVSLLCV